MIVVFSALQAFSTLKLCVLFISLLMVVTRNNSTDSSNSSAADKVAIEQFIEIRQINLNTARAPTFAMADSLIGRDTFIMALQEPRVVANKLCHLPPNIGKLNTANRSRAALIYSNNLSMWSLEKFSGRDTETALWNTNLPNYPKILLCSLYRAEADDSGKIKKLEADTFFPKEFTELVKYAYDKRLPLIVCSDINAHSTLWGNETDARGELAEEFIHQFGLKVENVGRVPTFVGRDSNTVVDVTLTLNCDCVSGWEVDEEGYGSDHLPISFLLPTTAYSKSQETTGELTGRSSMISWTNPLTNGKYPPSLISSGLTLL